VLGGIFASWRGIDGLLLATALLLVVGLVALANLRGSDGAGLNDALRNGAAAPSLAASRARLSGVAGTLELPVDDSTEEKR